MGIFLVLYRQDDDYSLPEQQSSLDGLQKRKLIETSQPDDVCDIPEALHSALQLFTGFMLETLYKELCSIHLYGVVDAKF